MQDFPEEEPGKCFIYALKDPRTGAIRYCGKTNNPKLRFKKHTNNYHVKNNDHKNNWIRSLFKADIVPEMVILEKIDVSDWRNSERRWIRILRQEGHDLVNATDGGEGLQGYSHTEETKAKIIIALTGSHRLESTKVKIAASLAGHEVPESARGQIRAALTGRHLSESHRKAVGEASKAAWAGLTPEQKADRRAKMLAPRKPWTPEMRAALSAKKMALAKARGGHPGVRFNQKTGKWQAEITVAGDRRHLGSFDSMDEAIQARAAATPNP